MNSQRRRGLPYAQAHVCLFSSNPSEVGHLDLQCYPNPGQSQDWASSHYDPTSFAVPPQMIATVQVSQIKKYEKVSCLINRADSSRMV